MQRCSHKAEFVCYDSEQENIWEHTPLSWQFPSPGTANSQSYLLHPHALAMPGRVSEKHPPGLQMMASCQSAVIRWLHPTDAEFADTGAKWCHQCHFLSGS